MGNSYCCADEWKLPQTKYSFGKMDKLMDMNKISNIDNNKVHKRLDTYQSTESSDNPTPEFWKHKSA